MGLDELTGLNHYPFKLVPVPRLHWEDPTADHLMTHEVSRKGSVRLGVGGEGGGPTKLAVGWEGPPWVDGADAVPVPLATGDSDRP